MELVPVDSLRPAQLDAVEATYRDSFPEALRAPFPDLLKDQVLVPVEGDRPVGFAVYRELGPTAWVFLRYIAAAARGRGTGSQMWGLLRRRWSGQGYRRVVLDVEDPAEAGVDEAERTVRERRIAFYTRLGAQLLPVRDYRPPHDSVPHRMRLLAADTEGDTPPLDGADVRAVVLAAYQHRYGLAPDDAVVRQTLRASGLA